MSNAKIVFATFHPKPDRVGDLEARLHMMVEHTRQEPGNEVYDLYRSGDDEVTYHLFERYTDDAALEAHRASDHYKRYRDGLEDLLATPIEVAVLTAVDVVS